MEADRNIDQHDCSVVDLILQLQRSPAPTAVARNRSRQKMLYILEQQLWVDRCNEKRNVGLMSQWGYADPETNPFEWVANVSLQANGPFRGREADSMGVGWFYSGLSSDFKNLLSPPLEIRDLTGVEAYYNAAITPWFHLTADVQVVEPAERNNRNTALLFDLRANIRL